jgi:hypothetical protein
MSSARSAQASRNENSARARRAFVDQQSTRDRGEIAPRMFGESQLRPFEQPAERILREVGGALRTAIAAAQPVAQPQMMVGIQRGDVDRCGTAHARYGYPYDRRRKGIDR